MRKKFIFLAAALLLLSIISSTINLTFDELHKVLRISLEILSILFSSSSAFMLSIYLTNIHASNSNKDSLNGNTVGRDLIVNQNTSIYNEDKKDNELVPALNRLAEAIEQKHKENVDSIQKSIEEKARIADSPLKLPSEDFMYRYVDSGRTISDKDIQKVWADLYIKEAKNPSSISFRTLEIVKNLTFSEMNLFLKVLEYCINVGNSGYVPNEICKEIFPLLDITRLGDIGLLKSETTLRWTPSFSPNSKSKLVVGDMLLLIDNPTAKNIKGDFPVYILTDVGVQLATAIKCWIKEDNTIKFSKYLKNKYNKLEVSLHKILSFNADGSIQYDATDVLK